MPNTHHPPHVPLQTRPTTSSHPNGHLDPKPQVLSQQEPPTNPRGIPYAPFIDRVEDYVSTRADVETTLKSFQEMISKYQFMQSNNLRRIASLKDKLPDLRRTWEMICFLEQKRNCEDPIEATFEVNDTLYAKAHIRDVEEVFLWLGANVMLSYPLPAASELLQKKISAAQKSLEDCEEDVGFLREQITTMEVATARVYNWDVGMRRKEAAAAAATGKEELDE
ncbi:hypothetical protein AC578_4652 [Pseudocercospora eumusae]|uniref:Prefoldin subunit 3 n=1 Tax=Pseudocercospora eumusae TaxID=321146 RepID=A0A139H7L8_9PEZI|nr:hypothetical protein AC578_4652 [Pseudocercospora eumusae]